ncbi:hypothetical protein MASR1M59_17610 [Melaminivora sp.]
MMPGQPRTPPRFVPTLTEVIPEGLQQAATLSAAPVAAGSAPACPADTPDAAPSGMPDIPVLKKRIGQEPGAFEEYVLHRVMQRIDLILEQRLRQAIARVTEEQTKQLVLRLRDEVEGVVRHAVYDAVAEELGQERQAQ